MRSLLLPLSWWLTPLLEAGPWFLGSSDKNEHPINGHVFTPGEHTPEFQIQTHPPLLAKYPCGDENGKGKIGLVTLNPHGQQARKYKNTPMTLTSSLVLF